MQILEEKALYSNFINSLRSPVTKQVYSSELRQFMKYHRLASYSSLMVTPEDRIKEYVISMQGVSKAKFKILFAALKNFYEMNDVEGIRWNKLKRFCGESPALHEDRAYSHEEIHTMVSNAGIKLKAAILLMSSSGIRIGALPILYLRDIYNRKSGGENGNGDKDYNSRTITVYANTKDKYITFITPECRAAIDTYLQFRERCGEKLTKDSPLFRKDFDTEFLEEANRDVKPWTVPAIKGSLMRLCSMVGIRQVDHVEGSFRKRKEVKLSHGFRTFFETQLINSDVKESVVKKLMGHKQGNDLTGLYYKPTEEFLYEEYSKAVDLLTINPANRLQRKVTALEEKHDKLDKVLARVATLEKELGIT